MFGSAMIAAPGKLQQLEAASRKTVSKLRQSILKNP
jgi:hypothetical protein